MCVHVCVCVYVCVYVFKKILQILIQMQWRGWIGMLDWKATVFSSDFFISWYTFGNCVPAYEKEKQNCLYEL